MAAAVDAGAVYLDSIGEPSFIRQVFEEFAPRAERIGTVLLTRSGTTACRAERLGTHLDRDPGVGLEVVVPGRVGWRSSVGGDDREAAVSPAEAAQRQDAFDPGLGADVVDEDQTGVRPWPADASLVRPETPQ